MANLRRVGRVYAGDPPSWTRLGDFLVACGVLDPVQLASVLAEQAATGQRLGAILVKRSLISRRQLFAFLALQRGLRVALGTAFFIAALAGPVWRLSPDGAFMGWRPAAAASARSASATATISATVVSSVAVRARAGGAPGVQVDGARIPAYSVRGGVIDAATAKSHGLAFGSRYVMIDFQ